MNVSKLTLNNINMHTCNESIFLPNNSVYKINFSADIQKYVIISVFAFNDKFIEVDAEQCSSLYFIYEINSFIYDSLN